MSDLISRSEAMKNYCNALCHKLQKGEYCNDCIVKAWLNNQPTAYDTDKVVEQLNDKFRVVRTDEDLEWNRAMDDAITIVEGGGVNGKEQSQ